MIIEINSIGTIRNTIESKKDKGWGSDISQIIVDKKYEKCLVGLSDFSHIIVVYYPREQRIVQIP